MLDHTADAGLLGREAALLAPVAARLHGAARDGRASVISRRRLRLSPQELICRLPALGDVLCVSGHASGALLRELPRGTLLQSIQLAPLLQCRCVFAASTITVEGPREWIECRDADGHTRARLYLLPDTDYLAWDALQADALAISPPEQAEAAAWHPVRAELLRFHTRALAGLQLLGAAETGDALSPLSRQLAGRIVQDEVASQFAEQVRMPPSA